MDPNLSQNEKDWQNRQAAYLKTLAFALDSFTECGDLYTTIVPLGENSITCIQIYHYPSDSLYSVFFALQQLLDNSQYLDIFYPKAKQPNSKPEPAQTAQGQFLSLPFSASQDSVSFLNTTSTLPTNLASSATSDSAQESFVNNSQSAISNAANPATGGSSPATNFNLQTQTYTKVLLENYRPLLTKLWQKYKSLTFDNQTGLVKLGVELSGTKDIGLQNGSFYDNVIFWRTWQLAQNLGLEKADQIGLDELKTRIIKTFWNETLGIFAEDQSQECARSCYSSDWLIILLTGFLHPSNTTDRIFYQRSVQYVIDNRIDQPFPLRYHNDDRPSKTYPLVRLTNHEYAGTAIWSYWGLEYVKTLYLLAQFPNSDQINLIESNKKAELSPTKSVENSSSNSISTEQSPDQNSILNSKLETQNPNLPNYRQLANKFLDQYAQNIVKYGGFPEVYDSRGQIMEANLYRSVVKTGWVVNWEQARAMKNWSDKQDK